MRDVVRSLVSLLALVAAGLAVASCDAPGSAGRAPAAVPAAGSAPDSARPGTAGADQFAIVDCLLPGQVRQLGTAATYVSRRRAVKTSARDCEIRGGEYVAYDRANYQTAMAVWLPDAESGNPKAQLYVGEIYEKGLGVPPDYQKAAEWYRRAADQGYAPAQINLGHLYEAGLGVPRDSRQATQWYRRASGLQGDVAEFSAAPARPAATPSPSAETDRLQEQLAARGNEVAGLQRALADVQAELRETSSELGQLRNEKSEAQKRAEPDRAALENQLAALDRQIAEKQSTAAQLDSRIEQLQDDSKKKADELAALDAKARESPRGSSNVAEFRTAAGAGTPVLIKNRLNAELGDFHALVIGNTDYQRGLETLVTPVNDAKAVASVLEKKYGFRVTTLLNAKHYDTLSALEHMRKTLTEKDNLLIYYAGHGALDRANDRGNWLPVDAEPDSRALWISNSTITDIINSMSAKHVLVIADSCYSGSLTRTAQARLKGGMSADARIAFLQELARRRSRTAMTSGGVEPVLDSSGGGRHSVFAQAFLDALSGNDDVIEANELFDKVAGLVTYAARSLRVEQVPQYAPIKYGGHGGGDFLFFPVI